MRVYQKRNRCSLPLTPAFCFTSVQRRRELDLFFLPTPESRQSGIQVPAFPPQRIPKREGWVLKMDAEDPLYGNGTKEDGRGEGEGKTRGRRIEISTRRLDDSMTPKEKKNEALFLGKRKVIILSLYCFLPLLKHLLLLNKITIWNFLPTPYPTPFVGKFGNRKPLLPDRSNTCTFPATPSPNQFYRMYAHYPPEPLQKKPSSTHA